MTVLSLLLVFAGIGFIVGSKDFAGNLAKGVLGAVLVLAVVPCLLKACCCVLAENGGSLPLPEWNTGGFSFLLVALAVTGFVAWRRRSERAKAREIWAKRNGAPRASSLPAPPQT